MSDPQHVDPVGHVADRFIDNAPFGDTPDAHGDPRALVEQMVQALAVAAPPGWQSVHAAFSAAGGEEIAQAVAETPDGTVPIPVAPKLTQWMRIHRRSTAGPHGAWLRLLIDCDHTGAFSAAPDYGDVALPPSQLLPGDAYLRDFQQYPRSEVPVWLLAHIGNRGQQLRSAKTAHRSAGDAGGAVRIADDEIPSFPLLWARTAVLAAVCRGIDAPVGPRCDPTFAVHLGDNGGSTVARLPGHRAVLSGGRTDSRLLSAAYQGAIAWPDLYRGAPAWVHNLYLDPRAAHGMLSFCYWYDGEHWYRSGLPETSAWAVNSTPWRATEEVAAGVARVWTSQEATALVVGLLNRIGVEVSERHASAAADLVAAAEDGAVAEEQVARLFLDHVPALFDVAEALAQLDAASLLASTNPIHDHSYVGD